jgi:hypothetical protein
MKDITWPALRRVALVAVILAGAAFAQLGNQQGLLDPNVAGEKELLALPHLNASLVKGILDRRPFSNMIELNAFLNPSLKKEQLSELYGKMFIHVNLNTATREELLLIPGMGNRMAHEFEEYRPYKSYAQFRKEIGKYVDAGGGAAGAVYVHSDQPQHRERPGHSQHSRPRKADAPRV